MKPIEKLKQFAKKQQQYDGYLLLNIDKKLNEIFLTQSQAKILDLPTVIKIDTPQYKKLMAEKEKYFKTITTQFVGAGSMQIEDLLT